MSRILDEPVAESPLWLEVAGYPAYLNEKIRSGAWTVFKKLIELDCAANARPDVFSASVAFIADRVGLDAKVVERVIRGLRKEQLLRFYLPDDPDEEAMFQFITPFRPPTPPETARERVAALTVQKPERLRYIDEIPASDPAADSLVQQVVDAYLGAFGPRINSFVLDELALLAGRFPLDEIRDAFARAVQTKSPSLWRVVADLRSRRRRVEGISREGKGHA